MSIPRILIVDDEKKITDIVASYMINSGYNVDIAFTGREALDLMEAEHYDAVILDLMLPDIQGEEICRRLRQKSEVPVIMLTAKVEERDLLTGFNAGTDDYLTKPFSPRELVARVKSLLRRSSRGVIVAGKIFTVNGGDLVVDCDRHEVMKKGEPIKLTPNEFKILTTFLSNRDRAFSREELITFALGEEFDGFDRTIDTHIKNLRQKIEDNFKKPAYILTVHGIGYKFAGEKDADKS